MKPNHLLTRLRQDIRKMASAPDEGGYLRYKKYATGKMLRLREHYRDKAMTVDDIEALKDCVQTFAEVRQAHDGKT